jgi:hypothetical protein
MIARMAREEAAELNMELTTTILFKQQARGSPGSWKILGKAHETAKNLRRCFPWFQNVSFDFGRSNEYDELVNLQKGMHQWDFLSNENITKGLQGTNSISEIRNSVKAAVKGVHRNILLYGNNAENGSQQNGTSTSSTNSSVTWTGNGSSGSRVDVSIPFVDVAGFAPFSLEFEDELRSVFRMNEDDPECCNVRADPNETVFHFRNFVDEMPRKAIAWGFGELSPSKIANELFGHLKGGDKLAIVTRFQKADKVVEIQDAIQQAHPGVEVRVIGDNSGVQDFCLLRTAQNEIVGSQKSTFVKWASFIGTSRMARIYIQDSTQFRDNVDDLFFLEAFELTQNTKRIKYEVYRNEEMEKLLNSTREEKSKIKELKDLDMLEKLIDNQRIKQL